MRRHHIHAGGLFAIAASSGSLVYVPDRTSTPPNRLALVDRAGRATPLIETPATYSQPRFSPNGQQLAVTVEGETGSDVWVYDLRRKTRIRLTTNGANESPIWSPDGRTVTFYSGRSGPWTLQTRVADGSALATVLLGQPSTSEASGDAMNFAGLLPGAVPKLSGANPQYPGSWTSDGRTLAFVERKPGGDRDVWIKPADGEPFPFLMTSFDESSPAFSPDGRFLAYVSDENGTNEVFLQPFPGPGGRWLVSDKGGDDPVWSSSGRELIFRSGETIVATAVQTRPAVVVGSQQRLFEMHRGAVSRRGTSTCRRTASTSWW